MASLVDFFLNHMLKFLEIKLFSPQKGMKKILHIYNPFFWIKFRYLTEV